MAKHTIQEAIKLTGKSRKTLYRYMEKGKLSYGFMPDERRFFETSELIRVFGEIKKSDTPSVERTASSTRVEVQSDTLPNKLLLELIDTVKRQTEILKKQEEQLQAIKAQLRDKSRLESKSFVVQSEAGRGNKKTTRRP